MLKDDHLIFEAFQNNKGVNASKGEKAEVFTHNHQLDHKKVLGDDNKHNIKYTYELAVANLPRDIDVSDRPGQERVINLAYHELVKAFEGKYKNPRLAAANAFDEDLPMEIISQYKHYQQHGFPGENREENAESADEKKERVQRKWDMNKKRWAKWKAENPEAAAMHAAKKAKSEDAENEPHGYPQGITAIQNTLINELKKRGFTLTRISHEDKERDKYPTVFMSRKSNFMHSVVEISGMGEINGEHYKAYLAGSNNSEDAESVRPSDVSDVIRAKLSQAYSIVKGLIDMLDRTPSGQTPYNEMAITHIVNLEEDVKTLSQILQDRMLKK